MNKAQADLKLGMLKEKKMNKAQRDLRFGMDEMKYNWKEITRKKLTTTFNSIILFFPSFQNLLIVNILNLKNKKLPRWVREF